MPQTAVRFQLPALTGTGTSKEVNVSVGAVYPTKHAVQSVFTGGPSAVSWTLERSLNGVDWETVGSANTNTAGEITDYIDKLAMWLRVNLGTFTAGTDATFIIVSSG